MTLVATSRRPLRMLALLALGIATSGNSPHSVPATPTRSEVAAIHEARLRKLHLVRPDLINYPISFDVVC